MSALNFLAINNDMGKWPKVVSRSVKPLLDSYLFAGDVWHLNTYCSNKLLH